MYRNRLKRPLDLILSLALLILLSPLLLLTFIGVKLTDPGPGIFTQQRVGRDGRLFNFYKFRSMPVDTGDLPSDQLAEVRLTSFGRLIRRTSLDELPQLVNILIGDMSFVGPRPPIEAQQELISRRLESGALHCRPGLTGLAQINGFDGMSVAAKAGFDAEYARNLSFALDARIVARTFLYLLKPPPKY